MKKLFAVIGEPIAHSMSPQMHNDAFMNHSIDAHYQPLLVKKDDLKDAVKGLKAIGISGFNVTVPHKTAIMPLLDEVDSMARQIGAVNTVVNRDGKFVGYNTDGLGYLAGLSELTNDLSNQKVLIIGAGGSARAIYYTLSKSGVTSLNICNRTVERAEELIRDCPYKTNSKALSLDEAENNLNDYDIIIQTTNVGMAKDADKLPISLSLLKKGSIVSDIIYNPFETLFLKEAKRRGAIIQNGVDMLVHQGALAFQYWTAISPDVKRMKKIVLEQLGGRIC